MDVSDVPEVVWARPRDVGVAWQFYVDGVVKVRRLNNGVVQVAARDDDWRDV